MICAYKTETGRRLSNQDYIGVPEEGAKPVFIVADGMGGHRAGDVASLLAVEAITEYIENSSGSERIQQLLQQSISAANKKIFEAGADAECYMGMGTTVVMTYATPEKFFYAHVGDSRLYYFNGTKLVKLTKDHSFVEELVDSGMISPAQAFRHPQRNILTRAVGTSKYVKADTAVRSWNQGDILMLCSDGLYGSIPRSGMEKILLESSDLNTACEMLVQLAYENGSRDNITVMLIKNDGGAAV